MLFAGIIGGLISSAPLGPINLWLVAQILRGQRRFLGWFVTGVIATDVSIAALALWGYHHLIKDTALTSYWALGGGAFLVGLGIFMLRSKTGPTHHPSEPPAQQLGRLRGLITGIFLCGSNPAFLMFWAYVVNLLDEQFQWQFDFQAGCSFLAGVVCGDLLWFGSLVVLTKRGSKLLAGNGIGRVRVIIAAALILIGTVAVFNQVTQIFF